MRRLALIATVALAPSMSSAQETLPGPYVVDGNGKTVGTLLKQDKIMLQMPTGRLVYTQVGRLSLGGQSYYDYLALYPLTDCQGTPHLNASEILPQAILEDGLLKYPGEAPNKIQIKSVRTREGCYRELFDFFVIAAPIESVSLASLGFTPPFTIKPR